MCCIMSAMNEEPSRVEQTLKIQEWIATGRARKIREAAGLSRTDIAQDCLVDQQTVGRWEWRKAKPQGAHITAYYRVLCRLEDAVGHTIDRETALAQV
jgi:DNA-binding transcriptional regulator YiaG